MGMRVLVVDDDELAIEMLRNALRHHGYEVATAQNGQEALEMLCTGEFRLVVSDWEMPQMSGVELCRQVRTSNFPGYIYIILLTAREAADDVIEGLSAGADDFLVKPFNPAELNVRIRTGERVLSMETRDVAIFAMAKLAESRDPETGAHLERMRNYARVLAQQLLSEQKFPDEMDLDFVHMIYLTSPLHDIGKVGIPDIVLLKPGRLNDAEFAIMKTHALIGAETMAAAVREYPSVKYLRMAHDIALSHHERFDGGGYPHGQVGHDIPLCGRIVALADVYDALTSRRVYKEAFTHVVAHSMVLEQAGKQFDPDVVEAFVQTEERFREIHAKFNDTALSCPGPAETGPSTSTSGKPRPERQPAGRPASSAAACTTGT
jgi:putative two-component system response regulator